MGSLTDTFAAKSGPRRQSHRVTDMCAISLCPPPKAFACPLPARRHCVGQRSIAFRYIRAISELSRAIKERAQLPITRARGPLERALWEAPSETLAAWQLGGASQAAQQVCLQRSCRLHEDEGDAAHTLPYIQRAYSLPIASYYLPSSW